MQQTERRDRRLCDVVAGRIDAGDANLFAHAQTQSRSNGHGRNASGSGCASDRGRLCRRQLHVGERYWRQTRRYAHRWFLQNQSKTPTPQRATPTRRRPRLRALVSLGRDRSSGFSPWTWNTALTAAARSRSSPPWSTPKRPIASCPISDCRPALRRVQRRARPDRAELDSLLLANRVADFSVNGAGCVGTALALNNRVKSIRDDSEMDPYRSSSPHRALRNPETMPQCASAPFPTSM